jgi:peptide/nickel transport system permease protein
MPTFWMSLMFQLLFAVKLGWLPTSGINKGVFIGLIMPGTISALHSMASKLRQTRSSMLDNLNADYVSTAQAKGVKRHDIIWKHCLRNALLPIITVIGSAMTLGIGGSVVLDTIFAWPGLGTITVPAIRGADYMTACGMILMMTILVGVMNLLVDLAYAFADPRVKARYSRM